MESKKIIYYGHGKGYDSAGSLSFGNEFARNVIMFGIDKNSLRHFENRKYNVLILREEPTDYTNDSFGESEKKCRLNFTKSRTKICLRHYNGHRSFFVSHRSVKFNSSSFCLESVSKDFAKVE